MPDSHAAEGPGVSTGKATARQLDAIDHLILQALRDNGRLALAELAQRVSISRANAYARVSRLKEEKVICGFTAVIDPRKIGLEVAALIALKVAFDKWHSVRDALERMDEIEHYALVAGDFDMIILVRALNMETIRDVILERLSQIDGIWSTTTFFVLDDKTPRSTVLPG